MPSLISHLSADQTRDFLKQLNYLNIEEYSKICRKFNIPISIFVELPSGKIKKTPEKDRKGVTLKKLKEFLQTGRTPQATVIPKKIVNLDKNKIALTERSRMLYGMYDRKNIQLMSVLSKLTKKQFKDGAIARHVIRDFWTQGKAPTLKEFAQAWLKATQNHKQPMPEWAFLTDRANGVAEKDWKSYRIKQAKAALKILNSI